MLSMRCEDTTKLLSQYIDDVLTLPVRASVDGHLDRCPVCRADVADLRSLSRSLGYLPRQEAPADMAGAINDALFIEAAAQ